MTFDVAVVGAPFLDLTFEGLERVPRVGEEVVARALHIAPGGTGMHAIGASRLGLSTALVAPVGGPGVAGVLVEMLEAEGVTILRHPGRQGAVPVTALLSTLEGVAMASVVEGGEPSADQIASAGASAIVLSLGRLRLAPPGARLYAITGGLELGSITHETLHRLSSARTLIVNASEAKVLTDRTDLTEASRALADKVPTAIVTDGANGAFAAERDLVISAPAPNVEVVDATGAGDLFVAAYVWADLRGASLQDRLAWASLYAGLSTRAPTALAGALPLDELLAEGIDRGLTLPPGVSSR